MAEVGRPTVMTELTLSKLDEAFANGATDIQACFIADISTESLYAYQREHPEYTERKQALKDMIAYQAKTRIKNILMTGDAVREGLDTAKWYLERKDKDFKNKTDLTSNDEPIQPLMVKFIKDEDSRNTNRV